MDVKLTRRDVLEALTVGGVAVGGGGVTLVLTDADSDDERAGPLDHHTSETLVATAVVLYPEGVTGIEDFVTQYAAARARDRPAYAEGIADAVGYLDEYTRAWYEQAYRRLSAAERDEALRRMGVEAATPDPEGDDVERLRYFLINDLLFALYASPTGGELLGIENPPGHPGGRASYQRGSKS